jgi:putative transposase
MSSTRLSLHYHLIFGTKNHTPFIVSNWRSRLHAYLGGILSSLNTVPEIVGGIEDHVHILAGLRATGCLADIMREIKSASSRWVHEEIGLPDFAWQEGYGAFTVSPFQREAVPATLMDKRNITGPGRSRKSIWNFLKRAGWFLTLGIYNFWPTAPPGQMPRLAMTGGLHHRLISCGPPGLRFEVRRLPRNGTPLTWFENAA